MEQPVGAWIRSGADLASNARYQSFDEFVDALDNQTDMDLHIEVTDDLLRVVHLAPRCSDAGQMTFPFPFDTEDVLNWVYYFENDHDIRYEVHGDVANMLDVPIYEDEVEDDDEAEAVRSERMDQVLAFVEGLLWDRWIDLDGSDLLLIGPTGGPLELTASYEWVTQTVGAVSRPFLPARLQPTVARLYADGRLALSWPASVDVEEAEGLDRPLPDLVVIDLATFPSEDALELYDVAYDGMYPSTSALLPSGDAGDIGAP